jgi:hypothetical protein
MERLWMERVALLERELKTLISEREALRFALTRLRSAVTVPGGGEPMPPAHRAKVACALVLLSEVWLQAQATVPALVGDLEAAMRELEGCL